MAINDLTKKVIAELDLKFVTLKRDNGVSIQGYYKSTSSSGILILLDEVEPVLFTVGKLDLLEEGAIFNTYALHDYDVTAAVEINSIPTLVEFLAPIVSQTMIRYHCSEIHVYSNLIFADSISKLIYTLLGSAPKYEYTFTVEGCPNAQLFKLWVNEKLNEIK